MMSETRVELVAPSPSGPQKKAAQQCSHEARPLASPQHTSNFTPRQKPRSCRRTNMNTHTRQHTCWYHRSIPEHTYHTHTFCKVQSICSLLFVHLDSKVQYEIWHLKSQWVKSSTCRNIFNLWRIQNTLDICVSYILWSRHLNTDIKACRLQKYRCFLETGKPCLRSLNCPEAC